MTTTLKLILNELTEHLAETSDLDVGPVYSRGGVAIASWSTLADKELIYAYVRLKVIEEKGRLEVGVHRGSVASRAVRDALKAQIAIRLGELDDASHHLYITLSPSRYELMSTLTVNVDQPQASWKKATVLIQLCAEIERAVALTLEP